MFCECYALAGALNMFTLMTANLVRSVVGVSNPIQSIFQPVSTGSYHRLPVHRSKVHV